MTVLRDCIPSPERHRSQADMLFVLKFIIINDSHTKLCLERLLLIDRNEQMMRNFQSKFCILFLDHSGVTMATL